MKNSGKDSALYESRVLAPEGAEIFIFSASGQKALEHVFSSKDTCILLSEGDKIAAAIKDSPYKINYELIRSFETIESITVLFKDDNPEKPVKSDITYFRAGDNIKLNPVPLMSSVTIRSVGNELGGYRRLEDPVVYLTQINPFAELFRTSGFRQTDISRDSVLMTLPNDVGRYVQRPGTTLYCYPNDSEETTIGTRPSVINFKFKLRPESDPLNGDPELKSFSAELPPLKRNGTVLVDISVEDESNCSFSFE